MPKQSAGILVYKYINNELLVFLVHPGGPFWAKKDGGAWSVPKGEYLDDEDPLSAAKREFHEETGQTIDGEFIQLSTIKLKSGKVIHCWAVEGDVDADNIVSNIFPIEWPYKSGKFIDIPEVDKGGWFDVETAKEKINVAQIALLEELVQLRKP
ncbi:NUDIX domain-containing protein [Mucilaginibacter jinjuensis]|uniref:NUDIX domain-containing protein n=1 Tax=Mucilaginibacter jinjuensis TaxID=1176721 RepID=A0ABY7T3D9_9SPHI|nr:NUDIX domain-containing protein [Mucilaginibacter jinjuensis]WCT10788.1 NUDIX domain-containing protein [Mucilaginibacter jinjuensis]